MSSSRFERTETSLGLSSIQTHRMWVTLDIPRLVTAQSRRQRGSRGCQRGDQTHVVWTRLLGAAECCPKRLNLNRADNRASLRPMDEGPESYSRARGISTFSEV